MPPTSPDQAPGRGAAPPSVDALLADPDTPLGQLLPTLKTVGQLPIPYSRLPGRARTAYAADLTQWDHLTDQTVTALAARPGAGAATVRALLQAALNTPTHPHPPAAPGAAAAATTAVLEHLSATERALLTHRVWGAPRLTRAQTADRLGIKQGSMSRALTRAQARLTELLAEPAHQQLHVHAAQLRAALGPYTPTEAIHRALQALDLEADTPAAGLLLHLAGPYTAAGDWAENPTLGGKSRLTTALDRLFARRPAPTVAAVTTALTAAGLPAEIVPIYLDSRTDLRRIDGMYVQWGTHALHHVTAVLHAQRRPASIAEIRALIGASDIAEETIRPVLQNYPQFHRASRTRWALRCWGLPEYRGIFTELADRVDAAGGAIATTKLVADMLAAFPDIAESSIYTNLDSLAFIHRGGMVRRRTDEDPWPTRDAFNSVRGAFRRGRHQIRLAIRVDQQVLRGSGRPIPPAVAVALGLRPGEHQTYTTRHGHTPLTWRMDSTHGPSIGSTQALATTTGAGLGDTLVLIFDTRRHTLDAAPIAAAITGKRRLALLLGRTDLARSIVATSLDCRPTQIEDVLTGRGDADLTPATRRLPDRRGR